MLIPRLSATSDTYNTCTPGDEFSSSSNIKAQVADKEKKVESNLFNKSSLRHLPNLDRTVLEGANNSPCVERVEVKVEDVALFVEEWI